MCAWLNSEAFFILTQCFGSGIRNQHWCMKLRQYQGPYTSTSLVGIGGKIRTTFTRKFLLPQANGCACVDFECTHPIDGLFWSLPIYLLGFFSKYECWIADWIMLLYHFYFISVITCLFVSRGFISLSSSNCQMGFPNANWRCIVCPKVGKQIVINQLITRTRLGAKLWSGIWTH